MTQFANDLNYVTDGPIIYTDEIISSDDFDSVDFSEIVYQEVRTTIKDVIKDSQRDFKYMARIYFDGSSSEPNNFDNTIVESMNLLEETSAESGTPLGAVSSNELVVNLYNLNEEFSPRNAASSYYGKLVPNVQIMSYVGIKLTNGLYEYVNIGTFFATDWSTPTSGLTTTVTCNDYLFNLINKPIPQIPIQENKNISDMFSILFQAMGLTSDEYEIDSLDQNIQIASFEAGSTTIIRDALQTLAERGSASVFCGRDNIIRVLRNNNVESEAFYNWYDSDMIIHSDLPLDYSKIFSQVELGYHVPYVGVTTTVLNITDVTIPAGGVTLSKIEFGSIVGAVESVNLIGAENSYIDSMTIGGRTISLVIANTGDDEIVDITVTGLPVSTIDSVYTETDATAQALIGDVKFSFDNEYIQRKVDVEAYATKIFPLITDPIAYLDITSRGNPAVTLINTILINDLTNEVTDLVIRPIRMNYNFTNGMDVNGRGIKKSILELM